MQPLEVKKYNSTNTAYVGKVDHKSCSEKYAITNINISE